MKARIEPRPMAFVVDIWFYDHDPVESRHVFYRASENGSVWERETIRDGAELPAPSLTLPNDALEALVAAGTDHLPPSSAQAQHLADARGTRDRLLAIVEHTTTGATSPSSS